MRFKMIIVIAALMIITLSGFSPCNGEPKLIKMKSTAYCLSGKTYSGEDVREGICANGDKDLIGKAVILYQRLPDNNVGNIIGIYEIKDTGCSKKVIDVWCPDIDACQEYMNRVYEDGCNGNVWVQIVEGEG